MSLKIEEKSNHLWRGVLNHLNAMYGFPANGSKKLCGLLGLYRGEGSTFRITGEQWRFVIDIMREDNEIVHIIAITVIARHNQDERRNGYVITLACNVHPMSADQKFPGAPFLYWYPVTSGGEVYQHCCDKESTNPDKSASTSRGTWETTRLRIIQKAYEQDAVVMRKLYKEATANASTNSQALQQNARPMNTEVTPNKKNQIRLGNGTQKLLKGFDSIPHEQLLQRARQFADEVVSLRHDLQAINIETKALRARNIQLDKDNAEKSATIENMQLEVTHMRGQRSSIAKEKKDHAAKIREQKLLISDLRKKNKKLETEIHDCSIRDKELANLSKKLESENKVLSEQNEKLISKRNTLLESRQSLYDSNAELAAKMEKMDRKKKRVENKLSKLEGKTQSQGEHIEALTMAVDQVKEANVELNATTAKFEKEKEEAIKIRGGLSEQLTELDNELLQSRAKVTELWRDMEVKNERDRRTEAALAETQQNLQQTSATHLNQIEQLKKDISAKDALTQRLHGEILCLQQRSHATPYTPRSGYAVRDERLVSMRELQHQREISRLANEKASDMESKLNAMKLAMEVMKSDLQTEKAEVNARKAEMDAERSEVEALAKKCAEKMNAANAKEAYTVSLEKQLEDMRGNMEGMLGRVSVYQGKKRRRTEGPDFQL
ncbi:hypothetical protein BDP55DRAFT_728795 [Colletotrichum godetiae]|uniref:Uncharacterized protein n=1 Tax=Colletotrichum godetiae TaxID=1209918 RepID=A0AAJ0ALL8_9PEZI|nr:uncharacterized protein BDP55DRAFT_728795 [Colletotrichum godetiae]KAK1675494.1 hypothetical protein BDP55DRAFT_728795 [Colletotrichum godetiae]